MGPGVPARRRRAGLRAGPGPDAADRPPAAVDAGRDGRRGGRRRARAGCSASRCRRTSRPTARSSSPTPSRPTTGSSGSVRPQTHGRTAQRSRSWSPASPRPGSTTAARSPSARTACSTSGPATPATRARAGPGRSQRQDPADDARRHAGAGQPVRLRRSGRLRPPQRAGPRLGPAPAAVGERVRAEHLRRAQPDHARAQLRLAEVEGVGDARLHRPAGDLVDRRGLARAGSPIADGALYVGRPARARPWQVPLDRRRRAGTPEALFTGGSAGCARSTAPRTARCGSRRATATAGATRAGRRPDPGGPALLTHPDPAARAVALLRSGATLHVRPSAWTICTVSEGAA